MRIFLSYGHDDYAALASRIKRNLETQGHGVWFDVERLRPGGDWERYIEDGLDWSSGVPGEGRFLLLLTPHSVRRPDGYCLNELARAFTRNLPIVPVLVSTVEPPLSICRLQWLDMRNCYPAEEHEAQYAKRYEQLVKALSEKQVPFEGVQQRLLNYLNPISYDDDLTRHLSRFTGREWVMTEVDEWLASSRGVLWITGAAGVGKSALSAWLCDKRPEIAAYHFCRFGNSDRVDARKALFSLAYQLSTQLPVYQDRVNTLPLDKTVVETNVPTVFDRLFVNLLTGAVPIADKPQILLIDALDEATSNGRNELASLIGDEFHRLPPWLRVIVTSRPYEPEINFALQAVNPWRLDAGRPESTEDIRKYLYRELKPFTSNGAPSEEVVNKILDKCEGLFLYASWVRQELQDGRLFLAQVEEFPQGLGGIYAQWFRRYFPDLNEYELRWRPVLESISAAREPLKLDDLASLFGWSQYEILELARHIGSLFPAVDGRVRPFHQSVRDWLTKSQKSGPYCVDLGAGERRMADFAWRQYSSGVRTMAPYCVVHAPSHLAACHRKKELRELLLDSDWIEAKLRAGGIPGLLVDYDLALNTLSTKIRRAETEKPSAVSIGFPLRMTVQATTAEVDGSVTDDSQTSGLRLVQGAIRLSANVIARDPTQFASQMVGRLLPHRGVPAIKQFTASLVAGAPKPWLRPLQPALHPPGTSLVRTLEGHSALVRGVAVSADGRRVVSASYDKTLKVWDLQTERTLHTLEGHSDFVNGVAVTADGRWAISASEDRTLKVWDLETGHELRTLEGHSGSVHDVGVSADGRRAVSASHDRTLKVWDLESGCELCTLEGPSGSSVGVAVSADGRLAVCASGDRTLKVWDLVTGRALRTLEGHSGDVTGVALTADGRRAVSASSDRTLKVWDLETEHALRTPEGHSGFVFGMAVSADGRLAVSASSDRTLKVWDLETGHELRTIEGHSGSFFGVAVRADGRRAVSASRDRTLKEWDLETGLALCTLKGHSDGVAGVSVSADGRRAVSASLDKTLKVWDLETGRALRTLEGHSGPVACAALSADGRRAVSASHDNTLKVWDLETGVLLATFTCDGSVLSCAFIGDNKLIAGDSGGRVHFLNLEESDRND